MNTQNTTDNQSKGRDIVALAKLLQDQQQNAKDYRVPTGRLSMKESGDLSFINGEEKSLTLNNWSNGQLASYCDIPKKYYDRIRTEEPKLLSDMVNHDLEKKSALAEREGKQESRLVRTVGNKVRAIVSNRFQVLDAFDLVNTALPIMLENEFQPMARGCELTEKRVYIKAVTPKIETEIQKGDIVQFGVMLSTSDVGAGSLAIEPFFNRLVCLNGMVMSSTLKRRHIGSKIDVDNVEELLTDSTRDLKAKAFFAQVRDVLTNSMKQEVFEREANKLRKAIDAPIKKWDLEEVTEMTMKTFGVTGEETKHNIIDALASGNQGAGLNMWGLANSFTAAAKKESDFDRLTELERVGGQIINLTPNQWKNIAM